MRLEVARITGENCITAEDGGSVYAEIHGPLARGEVAELDFARTKVHASPFFNAAVGRLLEDIPLERLRQRLIVRNLPVAASEVLERVIANAHRYYSDPRQREALDNALLRGPDEA